ncbi:hypothetical protein BG011_004576 [Mortierella polycephala]|uniref:Uncharacterized protein n=1 Tax=Mortierella polycephala TaxID=41804 RepID=A0A9P6U2J0_9FUNG|nr:hypothetical protein BG011_004576 [Mortierella polycephala]
MTNLRKLIPTDSRKRSGMLINEGREPYYMGRCRQDCQAFTLDSGLGLLRDIKQLRTLDLSNMLVGFKRAPEQQWIRDNWPMMEQLNLTNIRWYED